MSEQQEPSIEERIERAIVDRDALRITQAHNQALKHRVEIYRRLYEDIFNQLGTVLVTIRELQSRLQDLEDFE